VSRWSASAALKAYRSDMLSMSRDLYALKESEDTWSIWERGPDMPGVTRKDRELSHVVCGEVRPVPEG